MPDQIKDPNVRLSAAARDEGQVPAVGRQRGLVFESRIVRQPLQAGAVWMHAPYIGRTSAVRRKHNPPTVSRKRCVVIERWIGHKRSNMTTVRIGDEDITDVWCEAFKRDGVLRIDGIFRPLAV